jgi:Tfp pilus assembly protein PilF
MNHLFQLKINKYFGLVSNIFKYQPMYRVIVSSILVLICFVNLSGQNGIASISEEVQNIPTYPFSDPDPTPILESDPKIYPYHKFHGYSHTMISKKWKVVKLENDYIEVYVLPEVGGKVWGAIEKSTGNEFIYKNEVLKFRNISMRGPWTSGGIEFNFGIIGHHPSTATPVDYKTKKNKDGSVSCIVGNIDLPSRTQWRVEIKLSPNNAYFETKVLWTNPTSLSQSYYNWMTAAAVANNNLEFFCPGNQFFSHPGEVKSWPISEEGRKLEFYKENNFSTDKSYHVVGEYNDFFGGYYHDREVGFGHWSPYDQMPGQKLWLWALSRSGGIWEDLLTDNDGQYIEFQAGRLFNQYSPGRNKNPITQAIFEPGGVDKWSEIWFPVKKIGGISDVSPKGVLHVNKSDENIEIGINALQKTEGVLKVYFDEKVVLSEQISLNPMEVIQKSIPETYQIECKIEIEEMDLTYILEKPNIIDRPFNSNNNQTASSNQKTVDQIHFEGFEAIKSRNYALATEKYNECLREDPNHLGALIGLADLHFRKAEYEIGIAYIKSALTIDTYHPAANFTAGNIYLAQKDDLNALESFGWAARSLQFRSEAYAQMASIHLRQNNYTSADEYANESLAFNKYNLKSLSILAISAAENSFPEKSNIFLSEMLKIDPLNHFAHFEKFMQTKNEVDKNNFQKVNRSELSYQSYLELALLYYDFSRNEQALEVLNFAPKHPLVQLWKIYLDDILTVVKKESLLNEVLESSPDFVFPYRHESLAMLEEINQLTSHWKANYYLALNYWGLGQKENAYIIMNGLSNIPDYAPFYLSRVALSKELDSKLGVEYDLILAHSLNKKEWRTWYKLIEFYTENGKNKKALSLCREAVQMFPDNYTLQIVLAKNLDNAQRYGQAIDLLKNIQVLPFEGDSQGRRIWENTHIAYALELLDNGSNIEAIRILNEGKTWPENLGVGKPYTPDERMLNYILMKAIEKKDQNQKEIDYLKDHIISNSMVQMDRMRMENILGLILLHPEEALETMKQLAKKHGNNPIYQWLEANLNKDQTEINKIENSNPKTFRSSKAKFIKKVLAL